MRIFMAVILLMLGGVCWGGIIPKGEPSMKKICMDCGKTFLISGDAAKVYNPDDQRFICDACIQKQGAPPGWLKCDEQEVEPDDITTKLFMAHQHGFKIGCESMHSEKTIEEKREAFVMMLSLLELSKLSEELQGNQKVRLDGIIAHAKMWRDSLGEDKKQ